MVFTEYLLNNEHLIKIACDILTSFGTVSAVIIALYLSYRNNYPRSKIRAEADFKYYHNYSDPPEANGLPVISVIIANRSIAPIEVNAFGWVMGFYRRFLRKKVFYQTPNELLSQLSSRLPTVILFGQNSQFFISEETFIKNVMPLFSVSKCKFLNKLNAYFCYLFIQDSLGNFYYSRLDKGLRDKVLDVINRG
ncbi:MAG: hypothetical protein ACYCQI_02960 [Gammaproteobacteria bacterium]